MCAGYVKEMREALEKAKKKRIEIELLTAAPPPAGRPPNIRGTVKEVNEQTFKLRLNNGTVGTYSIAHLIGFVPLENDVEVPE